MEVPMKAIRITLLAAVLLATGGLVGASCTSGLSTQDAYKACMSLQKSTPTFGAFNDCVACFERCDDCAPAGTLFHCPDETPNSTGSSSSSSSGSTGTGG